jgi:hypothetical protein
VKTRCTIYGVSWRGKVKRENCRFRSFWSCKRRKNYLQNVSQLCNYSFTLRRFFLGLMPMCPRIWLWHNNTTIQHEAMHTLGFHHEHTQPDIVPKNSKFSRAHLLRISSARAHLKKIFACACAYFNFWGARTCASVRFYFYFFILLNNIRMSQK